MKVLKPFNFFLLALGIGWLAFLIITILYGYEGSFLILHHFRIQQANIPMQLLSWLGNGGTAAFLCWFFLRNQEARIQWIALISLLSSGILSQILKNFVFFDWHRPILLFEGREAVHFFSGQNFKYNSFPSGHATTAATIGFLLARYAANNFLKSLLVFLLTFGIGYSRVYNGLHFPGDVAAGWLLGFSVTAGISLLFRNQISFLQDARVARLFPILLAVIAMALLAYDITRFPQLAWSF